MERSSPKDEVLILQEIFDELEYKRDVDEARQALEEIKQEGTVPWEKIKERISGGGTAECIAPAVDEGDNQLGTEGSGPLQR